MKIEHPKGTESSVSKNTKSDVRRTFLKRATAGAVIASIPAKSVWANGITGSIIASGHGSDWNDGKCTGLLSPGFFKGNGHNDIWADMHDEDFSLIFGGAPIRSHGTTYDDFTLNTVIQNPGGDGGNGTDGLKSNGRGYQLGGLSNVNFMLVAMYLNSVFHGQYGIEYPIASVSFSGDATAFAKHIYNQAVTDPAGMANLMAAMITQFHVGDEDLKDVPPVFGSPLDGYYSGTCI
jgi:hypothetical protein